MTHLAEYVYISDIKLREFISTDRWHLRGRVRNIRAEIGAGPAKAGVDIELETDRLVNDAALLGKVERQVSQVATPADDPGLMPGEWMSFAGRIGAHVVDIEPKPGAVVFCQVPSARRRSVLLHGSAIHLRDRRQADDGTVATPVAFSATEEVPRIMREAAADTADAFGKVWNDLKKQETGTEPVLVADLADFYSFVVKSNWFLASAPFLAGFALVSAIVPLPDGTEVLIGSPLSVRRARPE
jgi:hypothetical protein